MIRFEHVSFGYDPEQLLVQDLSFHIPKGDFAALIGANGAGKSTISRLCNGLLRPLAGRILLDGQDTLKTPTSQLARHVGFLFQNPDRQICKNTVREELAFGMKAQEWPEEKIEARVEEALKAFDLQGDWFPFSRSRGERQRIALAGVLACEPELLILDEPTTGLDYVECIRIMDSITALNREKGVTVLMVSHDMELVQNYTRHVLVVNGGRLIGDGPVNRIMKDVPLLHEARVMPAQIPALALLCGDAFSEVYTIQQMHAKVRELHEQREGIDHESA